MNVQRWVTDCKRLQGELLDLYKTTPLIAVEQWGIHVKARDILDIAPLSDWTLFQRDCEIYPIGAETKIDGIRVFAVMDAQEKAELFDVDQTTYQIGDIKIVLPEPA